MDQEGERATLAEELGLTADNIWFHRAFWVVAAWIMALLCALATMGYGILTFPLWLILFWKYGPAKSMEWVERDRIRRQERSP